MTPETFLDKFDQLADAPNAVAKMRALLPKLAVQARLGPQEGGAEPSRALLAPVTAHTPTLSPEGELRARGELVEGRIGEAGVCQLMKGQDVIDATRDILRPILGSA